jgi:hypothetical protein
MEVIVIKLGRKEGCTVSAGVVGASISPLAGDGLDEAFSLAIGLRSVGSGQAVCDAELPASGGEDESAVVTT